MSATARQVGMLHKSPLSRGVPAGRGVLNAAQIHDNHIMRFPYNPALIKLARELRKKSTLSEVLLWQHLKRRQRSGFDFHRQKPVDAHIVDFFCHELLLAVEIDGCSHKLKDLEDALRQERLESFGIKFLRFDDCEVKTNLDGVVQAIDAWIETNRRHP